jgi:hypothetical protein
MDGCTAALLAGAAGLAALPAPQAESSPAKANGIQP